MFSKIWFRALMTCAVLALCAMPAIAQKGGQNPGSWDKLVANLKRGDFIVTPGDGVKFDPVGKYCEPGTRYPNALYANYGAPYTAPAVAPSPRTIGGLLQDVLPQEFEEVVGELPIFRLAPDEAIVLVGSTPPPEAYYGYQIYLATRKFSEQGPPKLLLNSLGDTVNLQTINTIGPDPFESPMVLIFTADQGIDARIRAALRRAGYPTSIINTIVLPSATLKLGFEPGSDTFLIANRNALWVDKEAGHAYVQNPTFEVLRLTPADEATLDPFPTPPLRVRGTGETEIDLTPTVDKLREAILDHYEGQGYAAKEYITRTIINEGYDFTQRQVATLGDTRDALYLAAGKLPEFDVNEDMTLEEGEFLIAYGLNHMATGKATYVNVSAYTSNESKMFLGQAFPSDMEDSAYQFLSGAEAEIMYAYKISRDCQGEDFCLTLAVPIDGCKDKEGNEILTDESPLGMIFRLYLQPTTSIGAAFPEVVYDKVIKFTPVGE
jgi:hypothetical protein